MLEIGPQMLRCAGNGAAVALQLALLGTRRVIEKSAIPSDDHLTVRLPAIVGIQLLTFTQELKPYGHSGSPRQYGAKMAIST